MRSLLIKAAVIAGIALLAYAAHNTTFISVARYMPGDRVAALFTCSYEFDGARYSQTT
jgi:hypothetical protein